MSRRTFLEASAATGLGFALMGGVSACFGGKPAPGRSGGASADDATALSPGYGDLVPDPAGRLSLPKGFSYRVVAEEGVTRLDTGEPCPSDPDGAAAFEHPSGTGTVLICNHEVGKDEPHRVPLAGGLVYDPAGGGGTTTIELDGEGNPVRHYVSLAGTVDNCAGGRTPWNTWLSCEETERILDKPHGYVFEVDPYDMEANRNPRPIKALGRFPHEAVAVDPEEHVLYLTEDSREPNGLLYRYTPPEDALPLGRGSLRRLPDDAGVLEAMRATDDAGRHVRDLSEADRIGTTYRVAWEPVQDRDARTESVRKQFTDDEVTRAPKLEGMWWGSEGAYVVSSFARGDRAPGVHDGQVWVLDPRAQTLTLQLRFAPTGNPDEEPDGPDNITVSPYGGVIIAEDGDGRAHLLGTTPEGELFFLARSEDEGGPEFCGPVFSADQKTLFANQQGPGRVFAIRGPFARQI